MVSRHPHELSPKRQLVWLLSMSASSTILLLVIWRWLPLDGLPRFVASQDILDAPALAFTVGQWGIALVAHQLILGAWFAASRWRGVEEQEVIDSFSGCCVVIVNFTCAATMVAPVACFPPRTPVTPLLIYLLMLLPEGSLVLRLWARKVCGKDAHNVRDYRTWWQLVLINGLLYGASWHICQILSPTCVISRESYAGLVFMSGVLAFIRTAFTMPSWSLYNPRWVSTTVLALTASFGPWLLLAWTAPAHEAWPLWAITGMLSGTLYASVVLVLWNWALESPEKYRRID